MVFQLAASVMLTGHVTQGKRRRKRVREIKRESGEIFMQGQKVTAWNIYV